MFISEADNVHLSASKSRLDLWNEENVLLSDLKGLVKLGFSIHIMYFFNFICKGDFDLEESIPEAGDFVLEDLPYNIGRVLGNASSYENNVTADILKVMLSFCRETLGFESHHHTFCRALQDGPLFWSLSGEFEYLENGQDSRDEGNDIVPPVKCLHWREMSFTSLQIGFSDTPNRLVVWRLYGKTVWEHGIQFWWSVTVM